MSTDWFVYCLDCKARHHFDDANHMADEMLNLVAHADTLASLVELFKGSSCGLILSFAYAHYGSIDPAWFRQHLGHQLMPIDEYGRLLDQCRERAKCDQGHEHPCGKKHGHEPPCGRGEYS